MAHPNEHPDPGTMPESVAAWAAAMRGEFEGPLNPSAARLYSLAAAGLARTRFEGPAEVAGSRWARPKQRTAVVASTFFSTWIAKLLGGVVAIAAATGGAAAAGVDFQDLLPFLDGQRVPATTVPAELPSTAPGGPAGTSPESPTTTQPIGPATPGGAAAAATTTTTTTTTTVPGTPPTTTATVPGASPTTTIPQVRPPLSPPVGPPG